MKLPRLPNPGNLLEAKYTKEQMHAYALKAMAQEREACAVICEEHAKEYDKLEGNQFADVAYQASIANADAILARGEA